MAKNLEEANLEIESQKEEIAALKEEVKELQKSGGKRTSTRKRVPNFKPDYKITDKVLVKAIDAPHHKTGEEYALTAEQATYFIVEGFASFVKVLK